MFSMSVSFTYDIPFDNAPVECGGGATLCANPSIKSKDQLALQANLNSFEHHLRHEF